MATYRKLQSGRWQVQIRSKNRAPLSKTFSSKLEADKWARQTESQIDLALLLIGLSWILQLLAI